MDAHFVKEIEGIITYCSHPEKPHIFYLFYSDLNYPFIFIFSNVYQKKKIKLHFYLDNISKELLVFEEDIQNHAIVNRFSVPREGSKIKDTHGYNLSFYRKKNFLVLTTPSTYLIVWETTNRGENR